MNPADRSKNNKILNIASHLKKTARDKPFKRAVVYPSGRDAKGRTAYTHLTFMQLDRESDRLAHGLKKVGITRGVKTVLMVKPGLEFFALTFALFKTGAIPVIVDPGMGIKRMVRCFKESGPKAFIGIPIAHIVRKIYPKFFSSVKIWITVGQRWFWRGYTLKHIRQMPWKPFKIAATRPTETAAILFTTGSTGPARGVVYTHKIFDAQIKNIKSHFQITEDEIDLPTFPIFALFDPALGITAIIPDMNPVKPAMANPEKIIEAINDQGVTNMFASPALLNRVGAFGKKHGIKLLSLKRVISAGAPVTPDNIEQFSFLLDKNAKIHTPYGATEAMPVLSVKSDEILSETQKLSNQGYGICVGRPVCGISVSIIKISDQPIENWSDDLPVKDGEIGEIIVAGDLVTLRYLNNPKENRLAKIKNQNITWHRMGDLGWKDGKGRIWFCGRKGHRVVISKNETLFSIPCEAIFNNHPKVFRSALVGVDATSGQKKPVIIIELKKGNTAGNKKKLKKDLFELASHNLQTSNIKTILFHKGFPVDIRHNSKIFREKLAIWAKNRVK